MTDYIRKAVELAEGFEADVSKDGNHQINWFKPLGRVITAADWWIIDALAAQLVRQVDALPRVTLEAYKKLSRVTIFDQYELPSEEFYGRGDDRTMNTIRATIDSGVLER